MRSDTYSRLRSISLKVIVSTQRSKLYPQVDKDVTHTTLRSIRIASHSQVDKNDNSPSVQAFIRSITKTQTQLPCKAQVDKPQLLKGRGPR
jgi:hypothetical protein